MRPARIRCDTLAVKGRKRECTSCGDAAVREYTIGIGVSTIIALCDFCDGKLLSVRNMVTTQGWDSHEWYPAKKK